MVSFVSVVLVFVSQIYMKLKRKKWALNKFAIQCTYHSGTVDHSNAFFYELKKLKPDMIFDNSFKKFRCYCEIIIHFNFATKCHSFRKIALHLKVLMIFGHF